MVPSTESASSLHKQEIGDITTTQQPLHRHSPSPTAEIRGFEPVAIPTRSTDSFRLEDSPLITSLQFPSPPEKPSRLLADYGRSQVTPPARRTVTPEPSEPQTPTMLSPETGRFQSSSKSYPSPVQAGFRSPSSQFGADPSGRRSFSGPSFQSARALDFGNNQTPTPTRIVQFPRDRSRSDSFGSNAEQWHRSTSRPTEIRMPDITEAGRDRIYSGYGFEVPDFAVDDFDPLSPEAAGRVNFGVPEAPLRTAFPLQLDSGHETPDISISELVSSPPSVDTGVDYETVQTTLVTPEARHFPGIHSPPSASAKQWTSPGVIGLGEGIAGGPQRDERGKRIDLRRWRMADPMTADNPRTAVDVYTNADQEKQKPGFKKRFSQSVLNLLGDKKSSKNQEVTGHEMLQSQPAKKNLKRSVSDLLGLSGRTRTYDWDQPQGSHVTLKATGNNFKRSESSPANLAAIAGTRSPLLPFLQRSHRNLPSQQMRKQASGLPASPSMPALSAILNRKDSPDLRIQNWLNASQAALHDTRSTRYDFGKALSSEDVYEYATGPKSPSIASRILSLRPESRAEVKDESRAPSVNRQHAKAEVPAAAYTPAVAAESHHHTTLGTLERRQGQNLSGVDSAIDLPAAHTEHDKKRKKRTSLKRFTSWLGFGEKSSKKPLAREGTASESSPSRAITPAMDQRLGPAEIQGSRKRPHFTQSRSLVPDGQVERDPQTTSRRRSGADWLGSVGWRRWENASQASLPAQREPHIVLLSSEHLPPPTMNAQGFLESTPNRSLLPVPVGQPVHQALFAQSQDPTADYPFFSSALLAPRMERDLSRLSERDEEDVARHERFAVPSIIPPTPGHINRNNRKPPPTFSDVSTQDRFTLGVPISESSRRRSSGADHSRKVLSITSLSSISTGLAEGEDHGATIQTVLASPIHNDTPKFSAPVVSRGVSLDLAMLTDAERSAMGFGVTGRRAVAI